MAHFKPFARAKAGPPRNRRDSERNSYNSESSYSRRRYRKRNTGLIVIDLGL